MEERDEECNHKYRCCCAGGFGGTPYRWLLVLVGRRKWTCHDEEILFRSLELYLGGEFWSFCIVGCSAVARTKMSI